MDTLIALNKKDSVIQKILYHLELFESFENVYLFGSILKEKRTPNDIDLLLIYKDFSSRLLFDLDNISALFNQLYGFYLDLTILSKYEEDETSFLKRLNSNYIKIK